MTFYKFKSLNRGQMELMTPKLQPQIQSLSGKHAVIRIIQQRKRTGGYLQLCTDAEMLCGVVHWVQEVYGGQALPLCDTTLNICPFPRLGSCPSHDWAWLVVPFYWCNFFGDPARVSDCHLL